MNKLNEAERAAQTWDGRGMTLAVDQNVSMPQTPAGTLVFGYFNLASQNNRGELSVSSGGNPPMFFYPEANANQPSIYRHNWNADNLSVTNISANKATPIWIAGYGPGVPGQSPLQLPIDTPVPLVTGQSAQGNAKPQYMQLILQSPSATLSIFAVVGGPQDSTGNNGYVFAVNATANTGPDGPTPPPGYYATTTSNTYTFQFNWGASLVYVVNMSPTTAVNAQVTMRKL